MLQSDPEKILHNEESFIKQTCLNFDNLNVQFITMEKAKTVVGEIGWSKVEENFFLLTSYSVCYKKEKLHLEFLSLSK